MEELITYEGETEAMLSTPDRCAYFASLVTQLRRAVATGEERDWALNRATLSLTRTTIARSDAHQNGTGYQLQIKHTLRQDTGAGKIGTIFEESVYSPRDNETRTTRLAVGSDSVEVTYPEGHRTTTNSPALVDSFLNAAEHNINHRPGDVEDSQFNPDRIASLSLFSVTG